MKREIVKSERSPAAVGPYSQAVRIGGFVFTSGILPLLVDSGALVSGGIVKETRACIENLQAVLEEAGCTLADVVKNTVYITDMSEFSLMNETYGEYFADTVPARATVEVGALAKGARIEIAAVAAIPER
jgi:2-iminobutanoate/2-iminopropanoate deaminase